MWSSRKRASSSSARASISRLLRRATATGSARSTTALAALAGGAELHVLDHRQLGEALRELERAHHAAARPSCAAATPSIDVPSNVQSPASGLSKPVIRLKNVVLPAPFGPINAVIEPRCTSTWSTSTAMMPPKCRRTPVGGRGSGRAWRRPARARRRRAPPRGDCGRSRDVAAAGAGVQRPSNAISLRLPKRPCGRKSSAASAAAPPA